MGSGTAGSGGGSGKKNFDGRKSVADMLHFMDKESRERLLGNLSRANPEVAQDIRQKMFCFEDLIRLEDREIQLLLKSITSERLRLALRTASEELTLKFLENMSVRAASLLKEELASQGPQRKSVVDRAQAEIAEKASELFRVRAR